MWTFKSIKTKKKIKRLVKFQLFYILIYIFKKKK